MLKDIQKAIDKMFKDYSVKSLETSSEYMNEPDNFSSVLSSEVFKAIIAEPPAPKPAPQTNTRTRNQTPPPEPAPNTPPQGGKPNEQRNEGNRPPTP